MTTPICPCCKAKFAHDSAQACCKQCGLPDEAIGDPAYIEAWRRGQLRQQRPERKAAKKTEKTERVHHKSMYRKMSREKRRAA